MELILGLWFLKEKQLRDNEKTIVIGTSPNTYRYAYQATLRIEANGYKMVPAGIHTGFINSIEIMKPPIDDVHTISMYISPENQGEWINYIYSLNPQGIIFNPDAENADFQRAAENKNIETINACIPAMPSVGNY